jgi:hypothetical protein
MTPVPMTGRTREARGVVRFGTARRFAVCFENSVPVASGAWHAQVWVKVLAP